MIFHLERKGSFHRLSNGSWAPNDIHVWIGPLGLHLWRYPFAANLDWCWNWRD